MSISPDPPSSKNESNQATELHARIAKMAATQKKHSPLFLFFEEPHSGPLAQHFANVMTVIVVISIIGFCMETENVRVECLFFFGWYLIKKIYGLLYTCSSHCHCH